MSSLLCPLCGKRIVVIMTCTRCWERVSMGKVSVEDRAKIALYERLAPMSDWHRTDFNALKRRHLA
jgi:hypothetical protein